MGIVPGGGGTQYLADRVGRNRALEVVLGASLFDAQTVERYGWVNRAVPADEIDAFVDALARDIAALPDGVIAAAKSAPQPADLGAGMITESQAWGGLIYGPAAGQLMAAGVVRPPRCWRRTRCASRRTQPRATTRGSAGSARPVRGGTR